MPFNGHEVWAHADSYPHPMSCDDHIGRIRNYNDMTYMMSPFNFQNGIKNTAANSSVPLTIQEKDQEPKQQASDVENWKSHGRNDNIGDLHSNTECNNRAKRSAFDFLINNVGYDGSNTQTAQNAMEYNVSNNAKKRLMSDESEVVNSKRVCLKDCEEMDIDGSCMSTEQQEAAFASQANNLLAQSTITATDNIPSQAGLQYQTQNNSSTANSLKCGSGQKTYIWQKNIQEHVANQNSTNSTNNLYGSCQSKHKNIESIFISCDDDIEFMYQTTHGGSLMRQQNSQYDDL